MFASSAGTAFRQFAQGWLADPDSGRIERAFSGPLMTFSKGTGSVAVISLPAVDPRTWRGYAGGARGEIWIGSADRRRRRLSPVVGNISTPLLCRRRIYFVADEDGQTNLFSCDLKGLDTRRETRHSGFAVHSPATDGRRIVYCFGPELFLLDPSGPTARIEFRLAEPVAARQVRTEPAGRGLSDVDSAFKKPAMVVCAFGRVFEYALDLRSWKGLEPPGYCSHARYLPDGSVLVVRRAPGGDELAILGVEPRSYRALKTGRDLGRIVALAVPALRPLAVVANDRNEIFSIELDTGATVLLDRSAYRQIEQIDVNMDGDLCAYAFPAGMHRTVIRVVRTDGGGDLSETDPPLADFAPGFVAENSIAFLSVRTDAQSAQEFRTSLHVWDLPASGRSETIRRLPSPADSAGIVCVQGEIVLVSRPDAKPETEAGPVLQSTSRPGARTWNVSADRVFPVARKALRVQVGSRIYTVRLQNERPARPMLETDLDQFLVDVDPPRLWLAAMAETCRLAATHVPASALAGRDWSELGRQYATLMRHASDTPSALAVLNEFLGHLRMSHAFVARPRPSAARKRQGLLGVDTEFDSRLAAWRITRIPLVDTRWTFPLGLADPSIAAREGDIIVAIDGLRLTRSRGLPTQLAGKGGQSVRCGLRSSKKGPTREVAFEALSDERPLRYAAWVLERERLVAGLTSRRAAYVHLADTSARTRMAIERWLSCHEDVRSLIVDLRYNEGGAHAGEIAEILARKPIAEVHTRWSRRRALPIGAAERVIVVLANRFTSSGGELVAEELRRSTSATIIGEQTFGGAMGHTVSRRLPDGSLLWLPEIEIVAPQDFTSIENRGVAPDIWMAWHEEWDKGPDGLVLRAIRELRHREATC